MVTISAERAEPGPTPAGAPAARSSRPHGAPAGADAPAIRVRSLGKCYHVYDRPADRLRQALFRNRRRFYREFWALRAVDLTLERGRSLGIIGRNGSGKSTLLQIIAGTLAPSEGTVEINGQVAALLELGAGFSRDFTGRENIELAGALRGLSREETAELMPRITEFADIGEFIDQPVRTYSSGMYVRLAFAVSAHVRPDILIVDEALAVGDVFFQQKCHRFMAERLRDTTRLLVSHDLRAIANHCERVLVLDRGRVVCDAPPREAIAAYTSLVHREQFGAPTPVVHGARADAVQGGMAGPNAPIADFPWVRLKDTGEGPLALERVALTDVGGRALPVLKPADRFTCHFLVRAAEPLTRLIFGVVIRDRFGNAVCGDNSLSLPSSPSALPAAGRYAVRLQFSWPELQPGDYTATFGVGRGEHPHHHDVLSWAQNAIAIRAVSPARPVHGLFTNPVLAMEVTPIDGD